MKRNTKTFTVALTDTLKQQLLQWSQQFDEVAWLLMSMPRHMETTAQYWLLMLLQHLKLIPKMPLKNLMNIKQQQKIGCLAL